MSSLNGKRVMLVEDEPIVAMVAEDMLQELGLIVVGTATTLPEALTLAQTETLDVALIDLNLNGKVSHEVAHTLRQRGVPFVVATGYSADYRDDDKKAAVLPKPYTQEQLEAVLRKLLG